jgi:DNA modification methylase
VNPPGELNLFGQSTEGRRRGAMAERFGAVPFSVLNTREGWWRERKEAWIRTGIKGELGRAAGIVPNGTQRPKEQDGCFERPGDGEEGTGASVFDPVLCELVYSWFCPKGGLVIDPFAGGSVRGILAHMTGRRYVGYDLNVAQVEANRAQGRQILPVGADVNWREGDSRDAGYPEADLVFTCPPYGNLERYSDDPRDLSTMSPGVFRIALQAAMAKAIDALRPNSFAAIVLGEYRGKDGNYVGFVPRTILDLIDLGLKYYNEAILLTPVGTLRLRVGKQFAAGRKLGKTHQNLLVFVKGDWRKAAERCEGGANT